ncbi:hypothetical protein IIB34_00210 [PVC group bacterium]|nr:hypothetical protein [PVC group bacterium]
MEKHKVTTDITDREKIFINPNNGERITKLKGGEKAPDIEHKEGQSGGSSEQPNQEGEKGTPFIEDTKPESLSVEKRMDKIEEMFGRVLEKLK